MQKFIVPILFTILFTALHLKPDTFLLTIHAQAPVQTPQQYTAIITDSTESPNTNPDPTSMWSEQPNKEYKLTITSGEKSGQNIEILQTIPQNPSLPNYKTGDRVIITATRDMNNQDLFYISDFERSNPIFWLSVFFVLLTIIVGRTRGLFSLVGMGLSFLILFYFTIPQIMNHNDPVIVTILTSFALVPITFYMSHGFNYKTTSAIISTFIALLITGLLATIMVDIGHLTGFTSDEASFLQLQVQGTINIRGLLLAGIIIGTLGILDDITISQAAIVSQLKKTSPSLKFWELYNKAMDIGHDHIASVVNTLVLVYTGASLPLLLLFVVNSANPTIALNYEVVAEEIIRTLVASIGLILAVPISTLLATQLATKK